MAEMSLDLNQTLDIRIAQFKNDPQKMADINEFLNDVLEKAQKEADQRRNTKGPKGKLTDPKKSEHGRTVLSRLPEFLRRGSLPQYATVPIQCGLLLLLATIIIRKYVWNPSSSRTT